MTNAQFLAVKVATRCFSRRCPNALELTMLRTPDSFRYEAGYVRGEPLFCFVAESLWDAREFACKLLGVFDVATVTVVSHKTLALKARMLASRVARK